MQPADALPALRQAWEAAGFRVAPGSIRKGGSPVENLITATPPPDDQRSVLVVSHPDGGFSFHLPKRKPSVSEFEFETLSESGEIEFLLPAGVAMPVEGITAGLSPHTLLNVSLDTQPGAVPDVPGGSFGKKWAEQFAAKEQANHPHKLRTVTTNGKTFEAGAEVTAADLTPNTRILLFVHGIFSSCDGSFGRLPAAAVTKLAEQYDAVLCFDHPTASVDPHDNAEWLWQRLQPATGSTIDVITHSRGGLVARLLAETAANAATAAPADSSPAVKPLTVRRIAFVGTPNAGTEIVDAPRWGSFINRGANLIAHAPGDLAMAGEFLAGLLELLKGAAFGATDELPGLECMLPTSPLMSELTHAEGGREYYAITTDFRPWGFLKSIFALRREFENGAEVVVEHVVFAGEQNDVAVPTSGVGESVTGADFPVLAERTHTFGSDEHVWHCSYFTMQATADALCTWFTGAD